MSYPGASNPQDPYANNGAPVPPADPYAQQPVADSYAQQPAYGTQPPADAAAPQQYGTPAYPQPGQVYAAAPGYAAPGYTADKTNTMALVAMIASIVGLFTGIGAIVGIICGHIGLSQIKRTGEKGRGMALTGVIMGYAIVALSIIFIVLSVIFLAGSAYYYEY